MAFLCLPAIAAAQPMAGESITVGADEVIEENFFAAGQNVELAGHFTKDVYVWGNVVNISGKVDGDVIVGGSYVRISGDVAGNVRAAGSNVEIGAKVGKNCTLAGASLMINENASIGWDLLAAGGLVSLNGPVAGDVGIAGGDIRINAPIGGKLNVKVDREGKFTLGKNSSVGKDVNYWWHNDLMKEDGAVVNGNINKILPAYEKQSGHKQSSAITGYVGMKLFSFAALLVIGLLLVALFGKFFQKVIGRNLDKFGVSLGIGFLILIVVPIAFIILMITIIGIPLALVSLAVYVVLLYLAKVFASVSVGTFVLSKLMKGKKPDRYLAFLIGLVILSLIGLIPLVGGLIWLVFSLAALGAFVHVIWESQKSTK
ncbi:MAG: hypothetical protein ACOZBH_03605 [Patescibacteria group bacterium]